jgi:putative transposase
MRRFFDFPVGTRVFINGREYQLRAMLPATSGGFDEPDDFDFVDCVSGRPEVMSLSRFHKFYDGGAIRFATQGEHPNDKPLADDSLEDSPDAKKRLVRMHYLTQYDANPVPLSTGKLKAFVAEASTRLKIPHKVPSAGTMRRMLQRGASGDRRTRILGDRHRRGPRESRMHKVAQRVVDEKADLFWDNHRASMVLLHCAVRTEILRLNHERQAAGKRAIAAPSYSTIRRYLIRHTDYDHYRRKLGARAAQRMFVALKGSMETSRILQKAIIDHTWLDCYVVDDRTMLDVGRPYLTVLIDAYSRYPLGFCLSFTPPSLHTAMECVVMGIKSKTDINQRYSDLNGEWLAFGRPETILSDNGWEFTGVSFQLACGESGISVEWAPVRAPEYKGPCERFFGTLRTQMINVLPGAIPLRQDVLKELGVDTNGKPVFTLSQIEELICHFVVDDYGIRKHRTLRNSPENIWRESEGRHGIPLATDIAALEKSFGRLVRNKTLRRDGIQHRGLIYRSDDISTLLQHNAVLGKKRGVGRRTIKANIKEYPTNVSIIGVYDEQTQEYVIIPCTQMDYAKGLSIHQHTRIQEFQAAKENELISEDLRCLARERFRQKVLSLIPASSLSERRRLQRETITATDISALISSTTGVRADTSEHDRPVIPTASMVISDQSASPPKSPPRGRRKAKTNKAANESEKYGAMPEDLETPLGRSVGRNPFANIDFNKIVAEPDQL